MLPLFYFQGKVLITFKIASRRLTTCGLDPRRDVYHHLDPSLDAYPYFYPSDGHDRSGPYRRPNIPQRIVAHRSAALPIAPQHREDESNSLRAIYIAFLPDTNIHLSM